MSWDFPERHNRIQFGTKARERIFLAAKGRCHICTFKIMAGEDWHVEHKDPLWAGGSPAEEDCAPAHVKCHKPKTAAENTQRAKETRVRQKHIGAYKSKSAPLPGTKRSGWKHKVNGEWVRR